MVVEVIVVVGHRPPPYGFAVDGPVTQVDPSYVRAAVAPPSTLVGA